MVSSLPGSLRIRELCFPMKDAETQFITFVSERQAPFDRRNSLSKLPTIINYLQELGYGDDDPIPYDDVAYSIEIIVGTDHRTIHKYLQLLGRHDYLKPTSTKPNQIVYSKRFTQVRTKFSVNTREYSTPKGYKFYVFGPHAPRSRQVRLIPPRSPLPRSDEGCSQKNMCVSHTVSSVCENGGVHVVEASMEDVGGEKKEEEVVSHTHICNSIIESPELTPEESRILTAAAKERDSNEG